MHGIGGRTIAEAQRNLSFVEVEQWRRYRLRHGGFSVADRVEQGAATICSTAARLMGNKNSRPSDFIPNRDSDDELKLATPQDFMRVLTGSKVSLDASRKTKG